MEQQTQNTSLFQLNIDANVAATLRSAASWAKVFAIIGFIWAILLIVLGFLMQNYSSRVNYYDGGGGMNTGMVGTAGMVVYIIAGVICLISSIFALNCGNKISAALRTNDQNALREGFAGARNYFALWAICLIIGLIFAAIGLAAALGGGGRNYY
jgi:MFS-type transporter involved in bile tolerance (Atg22 family)